MDLGGSAAGVVLNLGASGAGVEPKRFFGGSVAGVEVPKVVLGGSVVGVDEPNMFVDAPNMFFGASEGFSAGAGGVKLKPFETGAALSAGLSADAPKPVKVDLGASVVVDAPPKLNAGAAGLSVAGAPKDGVVLGASVFGVSVLPPKLKVGAALGASEAAADAGLSPDW